MNTIKKILIAAIIVSTALLAACASGGRNESSAPRQTNPASPSGNQGITVNTLKYEEMDTGSAPSELSDKVKRSTGKTGYVLYSDSEETYIAVLGGEKENGGYGIKIKSVEDSEGRLSVVADVENAGGFSTQVISYPVKIIKVSGSYKKAQVNSSSGKEMKKL